MVAIHSAEELRSSAVTIRADPVLDLLALVQELEIRISGCQGEREPRPTQRRAIQSEPRPVEAVQDLASEVQCWWLEHDLERLSDEGRRELLNTLLSRSAQDAALATAHLVAGHLASVLSTEDLSRLVSWATAQPAIEPATRDGVVMVGVVPWLRASGRLFDLPIASGWCRSRNPATQRAGFLVLASLLRAAKSNGSVEPQAIFELCCSAELAANPEVQRAVGCVLGLLLNRHADLIAACLQAHISRFSRSTLQLALACQPARLRQRVMSRWRALHVARSPG